ncbi:hypothetical protein [Nostoc sp. CCY0012]|uniref:hypothetical protein n=1 Tax=Nostoc sp. CCY0012 TaxID=1056123 RepID=UPI0039C635F3
MYSQIPGKLLTLPMIPLFLGSCLALIPHSSQAQNRPSPLPKVEPMQSVEFYQYEQNFQPYQPIQSNQYSQTFQRYLVVVDSTNSQVLQRVRLIEPEAYIRQYQGGSVIQSGIFSQLANAQNRVRELQSYGINNARIVNFTDGREISSTGFATPGQPTQSSPPRQESAYYAVIPVVTGDVFLMADNIRRTSGQYNFVQARQQPLGPHVAVGPFPTRADAERWNQYLRELGYGNSRVYYGR